MFRKCLKYFAFLIPVLTAIGLAGCAQDEPEKYDAPTPQIVFLFSPGGLGDMSYNDCILEGVQQFKKRNPGVDIFLYSPQSVDEAERIYTDWLKRPGSDIPVIFTLASSDYEAMVDRHIDEYTLTANKRILLFESLKNYDDEHIHTFQVSMYGASYLSGVTAKECIGEKEAMVLLGSSTDIPIQSAMEGFVEGFGRDCDIEFLADDWTGFVMPSVTYRKMTEWSAKYSFIFPVAGGSNTGIYRYSREFPDSPYLAGMDVDQSGLANQILGSVVKRFDLLIDEYFTQWLKDGTMPHAEIYGLESEYVDWILSPRHFAKYQILVGDSRSRAIKEEKAYYGLD